MNLLENNLSYKFNDIEKLNLALTHKSIGKLNNERLEFLGDAILQIAITNKLYHCLPNISEGILSRIRSFLVCKNTLADLGFGLKINELIKVGYNEQQNGVMNAKSVVADSLEAIFGAIFLDGGILEAQRVVIRLYNNYWCADKLLSIHKDDKTKLQELLQKNQLGLPKYNISTLKVGFSANCSVLHKDKKIIGQGYGSSKKEAEQLAAANIYNKLEANLK